jgi:hypothetical protein
MLIKVLARIRVVTTTKFVKVGGVTGSNDDTTATTKPPTVIVRVGSRESRNIRVVVGKIRVATIIDVVPKSGAGLN